MSTGPSPQSGRRSPYGAQPSPRDPTSQVLSDERLARHLYLMECRDGPQEATGQPTTHVDEADMRRRGEERDHPAQASRSRWSPREDARQEQIRSDELLARRMQADEHESLLASAERMERIINRDILDIPADISSMGYEDLLLLEDRIGTVGRGATEEDLGRLPIHVFSASPSASPSAEHDEAPPVCQICLEAFEDGETLRILLCLHQFHQTCVDKWLRRRRECPVCRTGIR
eukprot:RCo040183